MILPLKRYADFSGRSRRLEFWMFQLFNLIVYCVLGAVMFSGFPWAALIESGRTGVPASVDDISAMQPLFWIGLVLLLFYGLAILVPSLAVTVRRLHDRGMSGWWYAGLLIANFIPIVNLLAFFGFIVLFVILLLDGQPGENRWGPNPKDPGQAEVFA